jgi:hypothetical protein
VKQTLRMRKLEMKLENMEAVRGNALQQMGCDTLQGKGVLLWV